MATEEQIRDALRVVVDPELGMNVIDLGLIRQLDLESDPPELGMILTTPFCPYAGMMVSQVQQVFEETLGRSAKVTLLDEIWDPSMMEGGGGDWGLW